MGSASRMFMVNVTSEVLDKIAVEVRRPYECIGLLIGDLSHDGLWVTDLVPSGGSSDEASCVISAETLARVADDIIGGRIRGKIIGWYHSHLGYGIFMSNVDLQTQAKLLQFSPYIIAMVVDPVAGEFAIWAYQNGVGITQMPASYIRIV